MYYTQNEKIKQVGKKNLIVGIDIGSEKHYARAFDWRGIELSKKAYSFSNDAEGFAGFISWIDEFCKKFKKKRRDPWYGTNGSLLVRSCDIFTRTRYEDCVGQSAACKTQQVA